MQLFHGSTEIIEYPEIFDQQRLLDFGKGFYTTTNREQAERWAVIKQNRLANQAKAIVTVYEFDKSVLTNGMLKIKLFKHANEEWLAFVVSNRRVNLVSDYDMVIGPVANDTLYQTLTLYEAGILTKKETIVRLKIHPLFNQHAFNTTQSLSYLQYIHHYELLRT
jgi:hypothetical protein